MNDGFDQNRPVERRADQSSVTENEAERISIARILVGLLLILAGMLLMFWGIVFVTKAIGALISMCAPA